MVLAEVPENGKMVRNTKVRLADRLVCLVTIPAVLRPHHVRMIQSADGTLRDAETLPATTRAQPCAWSAKALLFHPFRSSFVFALHNIHWIATTVYSARQGR